MANNLETLPIEILVHISSYLLPYHAPERSTLQSEPRSSLIDLASTSRTLLYAVESYCRTTLLQWSDVTNFTGDMPKCKNAKTTHRMTLLRWKKSHCVWCGKKSVRKAVLATGFGCCRDCDKKHWPNKITKTNARKDYHLSEEHLFPEKGDGLPIINYGTYTVEGSMATMFLREDVEKLATAVHGDWEAHMRERMEKAACRRNRKRAKRSSMAPVIDLTGDDDYEDNDDNDNMNDAD